MDQKLWGILLFLVGMLIRYSIMLLELTAFHILLPSLFPVCTATQTMQRGRVVFGLWKLLSSFPVVFFQRCSIPKSFTTSSHLCLRGEFCPPPPPPQVLDISYPAAHLLHFDISPLRQRLTLRKKPPTGSSFLSAHSHESASGSVSGVGREQLRAQGTSPGPAPREMRARHSRDALMSGEQQLLVFSPLSSGWLRGMSICSPWL